MITRTLTATAGSRGTSRARSPDLPAEALSPQSHAGVFSGHRAAKGRICSFATNILYFRQNTQSQFFPLWLSKVCDGRGSRRDIHYTFNHLWCLKHGHSLCFQRTGLNTGISVSLSSVNYLPYSLRQNPIRNLNSN